jgi:hypothetical protein
MNITGFTYINHFQYLNRYRGYIFDTWKRVYGFQHVFQTAQS